MDSGRKERERRRKGDVVKMGRGEGRNDERREGRGGEGRGVRRKR